MKLYNFVTSHRNKNYLTKLPMLTAFRSILSSLAASASDSATLRCTHPCGWTTGYLSGSMLIQRSFLGHLANVTRTIGLISRVLLQEGLSDQRAMAFGHVYSMFYNVKIVLNNITKS